MHAAFALLPLLSCQVLISTNPVNTPFWLPSHPCQPLPPPQAYMDSTYITVDNYLASCGLSPAEVTAIRRNLMRPDALTAEGAVKQPAAEPAGTV